MLSRLAWIILGFSVLGLVITEYHFYRHHIDGAQYVELVTFLYSGGVLGKILPMLLTLWLERKNAP